MSAPVSVSVLLPLLTSAPVPLIALASVRLSDRLICSVPLLLTAPVPRRPAVPPLPTSKVPAEMVVVPL